jgi:hypothetical protein
MAAHPAYRQTSVSVIESCVITQRSATSARLSSVIHEPHSDSRRGQWEWARPLYAGDYAACKCLGPKIIRTRYSYGTYFWRDGIYFYDLVFERHQLLLAWRSWPQIVITYVAREHWGPPPHPRVISPTWELGRPQRNSSAQGRISI